MDSCSLKLNSLLTRLKVPEDLKLDEDADEGWMWADPHCATFLDWIIGNVNESNVVTPSDLQQFKQLSQQGEVLSGRHLDEALEAVASLNTMSEGDLESKIRVLTETTDALNISKSRLKQISSDLNQKICETEQEVHKLEQLSTQSHKELRTQLLLCEGDHLKFQEVLNELREVIQRLHQMYTGTDNTLAKLLCHIDLQTLYQTEQSYTAALAEFTDKRFFDGLSCMTGNQNESYYQLVNITDPQLMSLRQDSDENLLDSCLEVKRLQQVRSASLHQNVEARVNHARCKAACEDLEASGGEMDDLGRLSCEQLRNQLERVRGKLAIYSRELRSVTDVDLKSAIEQTSVLKETCILTGDYNLKIARQQYFLDCQQQVISKLIDQRARNEILTLMLEVEMEDIQNTRHTLATITVYLQQLVSSGKQRLGVLEDAQMISSKYDRMVVNSRDMLLNTVHTLSTDLSGETEQAGKVFTSYKEVVESAAKLVNLHQEKTTTDTLAEHQLSDMKRVSGNCLEELMLTSDGNESLSLIEITRRSSELKVQLKLLESNIKTIMSTVTQKRKLLAGR